MSHPAFSTDVYVINETLNEWGERASRVRTKHKGRVQPTTRMAVGVDGQQKQARFIVFLPSKAEVYIGNFLELDGTEHDIIEILMPPLYSYSPYTMVLI